MEQSSSHVTSFLGPSSLHPESHDIDIKATPAQQFTDAEFAIVEDLKCALEPVALAVEALSRRDINLISADAALRFCIVNLRKQQSDLAKTLAVQLHSRISHRYAKHTKVLRFLHSRAEGSSEFSSGMTSAEMKKFIARLMLCLDKPSSATEANAEKQSGTDRTVT